MLVTTPSQTPSLEERVAISHNGKTLLRHNIGGKKKTHETWAERSLKHRSVQFLINVTIMVNMVQTGMALELQEGVWGTVWVICEDVVAAVFLFEMFLLIKAFGVQYFRTQFANCGLACLGAIGAVAQHTLASSRHGVAVIQGLRIIRIVRLAKLFRLFPAFNTLFHSVAASMNAVGWLLLLFTITAYGIACVCVMFCGSSNSGYPAFDSDSKRLRDAALAKFNNYQYFGTVPRAFITLLNLAMSSDMNDLLWATAAVQPLMTFALIGFILISTLCILNTIIGVIVNGSVQAVLNDESAIISSRKQQMEAVESLASLMFDLDADGNRCISMHELKAGNENQVLQELLRKIDLPLGFTTEDLFAILDLDCNRSVTHDEFVGGMFRLIYANPFQRECLSKLGEAHVKNLIIPLKDLIVELREEVSNIRQEVREELRALTFKGTDALGGPTSAHKIHIVTKSENGDTTGLANMIRNRSQILGYDPPEDRGEISAGVPAALNPDFGTGILSHDLDLVIQERERICPKNFCTAEPVLQSHCSEGSETCVVGADETNSTDIHPSESLMRNLEQPLSGGSGIRPSNLLLSPPSEQTSELQVHENFHMQVPGIEILDGCCHIAESRSAENREGSHKTRL